MKFLKGKTVLVTGGAGTVGKELVKQIIDREAKEIRIIDNNESEIMLLEERLNRCSKKLGKADLSNPRIQVFVGDIRDADMLQRHFQGVDFIFHLAALKHVIMSEKSPFDAVQTNILGVRNVISAALANNVERVVFTSSDKAVNPTSVMGTSKLMGERLITAANSLKVNARTIFSSTRFGNVIGSRGSVAPIFFRQIKAGGPVTLTNRNMSRFIMTIEESVHFVLSAAEISRGGEVFVAKMPVIKIQDLAKVMVDLLAPKFGFNPASIQILEVGSKPGEKFYEELLSEEETRRSYELKDMMVVLPAFRSVYEEINYEYSGIIKKSIKEPFRSNKLKPMTSKQLREYLLMYHILDDIEQMD